jgi:PilZ domain
MMRRIFEGIDDTKWRRKSNVRETAIAAPEMKEPVQQYEWERQDPLMSNTLTDTINRPVELQNHPGRRQQHRAGVKLLVQLRPADHKDRNFKEILKTLNASRANLYVITTSRYYYQTMLLRITFPFSPHDVVTVTEDTAKVVRIDELPGGRFGVAIMFQRAIQGAPLAQPLQTHTIGERAGERRRAIRYPVSATANVTEEMSQGRLQGRCSDLSVAGCYVDTLNPLRECSSVHVQLFNDQRSFEAAARVITNHVGMGMGLAFDELTPKQMAVLVDWIENNKGPIRASIDAHRME